MDRTKFGSLLRYTLYHSVLVGDRRMMPTESLTNQQVLNKLEALLRRTKEKPCLEQKIAHRGHSGQDTVCPHSEHNFSGVITDPGLQAAWETMTEGRREWESSGNGKWVYGVRDIAEWPDNAVRRLLREVALKLGIATGTPFPEVPSLGKAIIAAVEALNEH